MSTLPSLLTSPKAAPRRQASGIWASPEVAEMSSNVPSRRLRNSCIGSRYFKPPGIASTCGYTCPFATKISSQPVLLKSTNPVPHFTYG